MKHPYIRLVFTELKLFKEDGIFLSGIKGEGEYKEWWDNGKLYEHCFFKDGKEEGEYKSWHIDGQLYIHCFYKNGNKIDIPKEVKDGYILANGKYYKD